MTDIILIIPKFILKYSVARDAKDLLVYLAKHSCYLEEISTA